MNLTIYKNNEVYSDENDNAFKKLEKGKSYFIEFENFDESQYSYLYFKFNENEINSITYDEIKFKVLNGGKFYFYTNKGFEKGGIKTNDRFYPPIYCQKIDKVNNIYNIDYKNILDTSFDCRLSDGNTLLEYPILERDSYYFLIFFRI